MRGGAKRLFRFIFQENFLVKDKRVKKIANATVIFIDSSAVNIIPYLQITCQTKKIGQKARNEITFYRLLLPYEFTNRQVKRPLFRQK